MKNVKISVIMPIYNCENQLAESIESVLSQTYEDWELILIDDGSTDSSHIICQNYVMQDERIKLFTYENSGVSIARNRGIKHARGEWVTFLDSDDFLERDALTVLYKNAQSCDMIIFGFKRFPSGERYAVDLKKIYRSYLEFEQDFPSIHSNNLFNTVWNHMYKRDIILNCNIRFPSDLSLGEDLLFNLDYIRNAKGILILPDFLYNYRIEDNDTLSSKFREDDYQIQKRLKIAIDLTFKSINTKKYTDAFFFYVIEKKVIRMLYVYSKNKNKALLLLKEWLNDDYWNFLLKRIDKDKIYYNKKIDMLMYENNHLKIYYYCKIRKTIGKLIRKVRKL